MTAHDQLWVRRLDTPTARKLLLGSAHLREAWTDFGDVGVGRRATLRKIDNFSQGLTHPGVDPVAKEGGRALTQYDNRISKTPAR